MRNDSRERRGWRGGCGIFDGGADEGRGGVGGLGAVDALRLVDQLALDGGGGRGGARDGVGTGTGAEKQAG